MWYCVVLTHTGVIVGFEQIGYTAPEPVTTSSDYVPVCIRVFGGELQKSILFTLDQQDGTASKCW